MKIGVVAVSNIKIADMVGATIGKPVGTYLEMRSRQGSVRYWEIWTGAFSS